MVRLGEGPNEHVSVHRTWREMRGQCHQEVFPQRGPVAWVQNATPGSAASWETLAPNALAGPQPAGLAQGFARASGPYHDQASRINAGSHTEASSSAQSPVSPH